MAVAARMALVAATTAAVVEAEVGGAARVAALVEAAGMKRMAAVGVVVVMTEVAVVAAMVVDLRVMEMGCSCGLGRCGRWHGGSHGAIE